MIKFGLRKRQLVAKEVEILEEKNRKEEIHHPQNKQAKHFGVQQNHKISKFWENTMKI